MSYTATSKGLAVATKADNWVDLLPCVLYECDGSKKLTFISESIVDLIGSKATELVGNRSLWEQRIAPQDQSWVRQRIEEIEKHRSTSFVHRLVDRRGLPIWVCHGLQRLDSDKGEVWRGCLLALGQAPGIQGVNPSTVDRFLHKMGNHFQLLNLVISSLRKVLPKSRETDVLRETVDQAIELTRHFSEYNQVPSRWSTGVDIFEVIQTTVENQRPAFIAKGTKLKERIDPSIEKVTVSGDPWLLELALGHALRNALEASAKGADVTLHARAELEGGGTALVKLSVIDEGCGIEEKDLEQVFTPFFSTKEEHGGLGLSMTRRFVEMHCGVVEVRSVEGEGTELEITLPAVEKDWRKL
jgi:signal transduction histidine kinase